MRAFKVTRKITVRNSNAINKYFQDIRKIPLLTPEEEANLALRARKGDKVALEKLVKANLRFVVSVAKQYQNQGLCLEDLIAEGNLGITKALKRFNPCYGFKFISYAVWWIRQSILSALALHSRLVRLPQNRVGAIQKVNKAQEYLEKTFHRAPSVEEISEILEGLSPQEVEDALRFYRSSFLSLDFTPETNGKEDRIALIERLSNPQALAPDQELQKESLSADIERCLKRLGAREATVIRLYYGIGQEERHTLEEIGEKFNLTRERVRQIKEKALCKLRSDKKTRLLQEYLG
jgi:RNA polymerase primary sigma factor